MTPAYSDGYCAGRAGAALSDNPHTDRSLLDCQEWRKGWLKAEADVDAFNVDRQFREPK